MRDFVKVLAHEYFQKLIVISVFLIPSFYWPSHEPRLMKFICFQTTMTILLCLSFLFTPKRTINNPWPALFLLTGFLNLFTHGMSDTVSVGVEFIFLSVVGIYVIANHLHVDYVPIVKKSIIILCLANCALFVTQLIGLSVVFMMDKSIGWERPSGFMCYPSSFALLCAVSMILCWEMRWKALAWAILPIGACLWLTHEYSVLLGLVLAVSVPFLKSWLKVVPFLVLAGIVYLLWHRSFENISDIQSKVALRWRYLYPVIQNVWARPIDGWGVGQFNRLPESFFGFYRGNWSEMHCEPLDLFFSMGIIGVACVVGWIRNSVQNMNKVYQMIFITYGVMACFHSPLHFADTLFLGILLVAIFEVERHESA